jgi:Gnt-I system high-affinity gluconate transporter
VPLVKVISSIKAGVGGTLGSLALIMGFGAMLGKMLADCGGRSVLPPRLSPNSVKNIQWAVVLTGFTVGFALFYEVGFVLMLPLVFTIAAAANILCCCRCANGCGAVRDARLPAAPGPNYRDHFPRRYG